MLKSQSSRLLAALLFLLSSGTVAVAGQTVSAGPTCSPVVLARETLVLQDGRSVLVDLSGIAAKDSEVALVGAPTTLLGSGRASADSLLGVTWSLGGRVTGIPIPRGHRPLFPKVAPSSSGWDILFFEAAQRMPGGTLAGASLWSAHFDGTWRSVRRIADFSGMSVDAGFASELVLRDGRPGLLLNFERNTSPPSSDGAGFMLISRTRSGVWASTDVPARTAAGSVTLSSGLSDSTPFLIGVVELPFVGQRFKAPSLGLRLTPNGPPIWFGDGRIPVRTPSAAAVRDRLVVAWSTSEQKQTVFYSTAGTDASHVTPARRLQLPVADGPRLVGFDSGAALLGLDADYARKIRIWWLERDAEAALRDSVVFPRSIFKYSIAKSNEGLLFIAALQVPTLGMSGDPSMEIVNVAMRCGSPSPSKTTQTRRRTP